jgi:queuine/archaeosine tRNA-ribosyltransferase
MQKTRHAIAEGRFADFVEKVHALYGGPSEKREASKA